jgi:hypothetical protein
MTTTVSEVDERKRTTYLDAYNLYRAADTSILALFDGEPLIDLELTTTLDASDAHGTTNLYYEHDWERVAVQPTTRDQWMPLVRAGGAHAIVRVAISPDFREGDVEKIAHFLNHELSLHAIHMFRFAQRVQETRSRQNADDAGPSRAEDPVPPAETEKLGFLEEPFARESWEELTSDDDAGSADTEEREAKSSPPPDHPLDFDRAVIATGKGMSDEDVWMLADVLVGGETKQHSQVHDRSHGYNVTYKRMRELVGGDARVRLEKSYWDDIKKYDAAGENIDAEWTTKDKALRKGSASRSPQVRELRVSKDKIPSTWVRIPVGEFAPVRELGPVPDETHGVLMVRHLADRDGAPMFSAVYPGGSQFKITVRVAGKQRKATRGRGRSRGT